MAEIPQTVKETGQQIVHLLARLYVDTPAVEGFGSVEDCDEAIRRVSLMRNLADMTMRSVEERKNILLTGDSSREVPTQTIELEPPDLDSGYRPFPDVPPMSLWLFGVPESAANASSSVDPDIIADRQAYLQLREGIAELLGIEPRETTAARKEAGRIAGALLRSYRLPRELFTYVDGKGLTYNGVVYETHKVRGAVAAIKRAESKMHIIDLFSKVVAVGEGNEELPEAWVALHEQRKASALSGGEV